jgi:hypothetical protein
MNMNRDKKKKIRSIDLMIAAQISLLIGILFLGLFVYFRLILLFLISFLCLTLIAPLLAILSRATTLGLENSKRRRSIVLICILSIPLLIWIASVIKFTLPYLYTPPAITTENYKFYRRCVAFVKSQNKHEDISVSWRGYYIKDGANFSTIDSNSTDIKNNFSEEEISEMLLLSKQMKKFRCLRLQKDNDVILFYKRRNIVLPTRPGIAFSINGINPNDVDNEILNEYKPFLKINNGWYMSRQLVYGGLIRATKKSLPKSLIDHSLRTEELGD